MKICYLTQTATDISDYYKEFFKDKDLFFITFKTPNPNAIAFAPKSTWSAGRNKLWEELKDKYDYYVFMDDDLQFYNFNTAFSAIPFLSVFKFLIHIKSPDKCYKPSKPAYFHNRLMQYLRKYKPEVLAISEVKKDPNRKLDGVNMLKNSFVRRLGYFDAQFTVFSNYAANKILPYDNKISGWWSSQIPVYLYAFHVFAKKAINAFELGAINGKWSDGGYTENYDGLKDCKIMLEEITKATGKDYTAIAGTNNGKAVNDKYGQMEILKTTIHKSDTEDYKSNYEKSLKGLENFLHANLIP